MNSFTSAGWMPRYYPTQYQCLTTPWQQRNGNGVADEHPGSRVKRDE